MRITKDQWAMEMALLTAKRSTCCRRHVGCVLLNEKGHVLSTGYNGVAAGIQHCNEEKITRNPALYDPTTGRWRNPEHWEIEYVTKFPNACEGSTSPSGTNLDSCNAIHAEQNALLQCRDVHLIHTAYVTTSPCVTCTKLLLNTSCKRIVYLEEYPQPKAMELWTRAGRSWEKCKEV
jgi:dCMP deaminase